MPRNAALSSGARLAAGLAMLAAGGCLTVPAAEDGLTGEDAEFPAFYTDFATDTLPTWMGATGQFGVSGAALRLDVSTVAGNQQAEASSCVVPVEGLRIAARIVEVPAQDPGVLVSMELELGERDVQFELQNGWLRAEARPAPAVGQAFLPDQHVWWQFAVGGGEVVFETSADGVSWSPFAEFDFDPQVAAGSLQFSVFRDLDAQSVSGAFVLDDLNLPPGRAAPAEPATCP